MERLKSLAYIHDWFICLILEVTVPKLVELRAHLFQLFLSGADLQDGFSYSATAGEGLPTFQPASI